MIIVRNDMIPFDGFKAITFFPFIFVREDCSFNKMDERHERIHGRQQIEMTILGIIIAVILFLTKCGWWSLCPIGLFYEWYVTEWLIRFIVGNNAYRKISLEQEAYDNESDPQYLDDRMAFSWIKYLFKL